MTARRPTSALSLITVSIFVLVTMALPLMFTTLVLHPFSSPKIVVLTLTALLSGVGLCVGTFGRLPGDRTGTMIVVSMIILAFLALSASPVVSVSFWGQHNQGVGVLALIATLLIALFALNYAEFPPDARWLQWIPLASPAILAVLTIAQRAGLSVLGALDPSAGVRPFLTMGNAIHLGLFLGAAAVYAGVMSGTATTRPRRWISAAICALCATGSLLTDTFSALAAMALAAVFICTLRLRWQRRHVILAGVALSAAIPLAYGVYRLFPNLGVLHIFRTMGGIRAPTYLIALETIGAHPLLGVGPANFRSAMLNSLTPELTQRYFAQEIAADAHNWLLEFASTYGLPLALLFAAFLFAAVSRARRLPQPSLPFCGALTVLTIGYLFQPLSLVALPMMALYSGLLWRGAALQAPMTDAAAVPQSTTFLEASSWRRFMINASALLAAALGVGICVFGLWFAVIDYSVRQAELAERPQDVLRAADSLWPRAIPAYWVAARLAAFNARFTDVPESIEIMNRSLVTARYLDPANPATELQWAVCLQLLDRHQEAIGHLHTALSLYPEWPIALKGIAFSYLELGMTEQALDILEPLAASVPHDVVVQQLLERAR